MRADIIARPRSTEQWPLPVNPCSDVPKSLDTLLAWLVNIVSDGHDGDRTFAGAEEVLLLGKIVAGANLTRSKSTCLRFGIVRAVGFHLFL